MMDKERRDGRMVLAALPGLGPVTVRRLDRELSGRAETLLTMSADQRRAWCRSSVCEELAAPERYLALDKVKAELGRMPADFLTDEDEGYPERLLPYTDRPLGLYRYRAGVELGQRCLAIVGTRRPTSYGRKQARLFASGLSEAGFTIVSGMAEGIDTEAHRATLERGGRTAAFLGGGLRRCYPTSNRGLMEDIARSAGVWSEFPLWRNADRRSFPQRNRIVSGVSEGVLVIESGAVGGSLITARMAAEQGKPVYVVPGRIDSPESAGCHALLRDGAQLVTSVADILEDTDALPNGFSSSRERTHSSGLLPPTEQPAARVWAYLSDHASSTLETLVTELGVSVATMGTTLIQMEVDGYVTKRLDGHYERL